MISITDKDIRYAEKIFLPEGEEFDSKRKKVIKCLESKDIVACPGSGKTTALLAKLAILAKKMPLENNKGVCVLTHTNVAIDEITNRLGKKGNVLFKDPNFFGTFQSFVNQFLAIPAYINYYGKRPNRIDVEVYNNTIDKCYYTLDYSTREYWLENQWDYMTLLKSIRFSLKDFNHLVKGLNGKPVFKNECKSEKKLLKFKLEILERGFLCYDDAYSLAFRYLKDFGDLLKETFSQRFKYVFIDEMQDTNPYQLELLEKLFDSNVVIQKIGDPSQAIFGSVGAIKHDRAWDLNEDHLKIDGSMRFHDSIANKVGNLSFPSQEIKGNSSSDGCIKPKIIVFNDDNINEVLTTYAKIIKENNLLEEDNPIFKAVGFVGKRKDDDKIRLYSYYENYRPTKTVRKTDFDCLDGYLQSVESDIIEKQGANYYRESIIRALLKILRIADFKKSENRYFTEKTLLKYLKETDEEFYKELNFKLAEWCLDLFEGENISNNVEQFIRNKFSEAMELDIQRDIDNFLKETFEDDSCMTKEVGEATNIFNYENIDIDICTVHSIKGETHTATLYLETFWYKYDFERLIEYLKEPSNEEPKIQTKANLKIAYVGMSRPSRLLCVAIHEKRIEGHREDLENAGWDIV